MFTFSSLSSSQNNSSNPTNRWFFQPQFNTFSTPQIPQFCTPNFTTFDPFGLTRLTNRIRQPPVDLELRLGQVGHTISYQEAMRTTTKKIPPKLTNDDNQGSMGRVSKNLGLTLGYRVWLDSCIRRGPRPRTRRRYSGGGSNKRCDRCGPVLDLDLNKEQADGDDGQLGCAGIKRKREYYGPCVRCGMVFDISQRYASHMRIHYQMDETQEEKMVRLAKKRKH
ncbi:hypothetical protein L6452_00536 [Arctium lappa]|uniref:Uncharacterized protein n=1 Tax=Arctium lappa TaxID=4217 RepID=A0ACB9FDP0_ARCLA|nr:hypothetical protein L6452_00536 [Arctium lappa]